jgi:hypothetical protein
VRRLSGAADKSRVWLAIAAVVAVAGGRRGRRAALEGVVAIAVTSAAVTLGIKPIARRRRPGRAKPALFEGRHVPMPGSASFPQGMPPRPSAFAYAVSRHLPGVAVPPGPGLAVVRGEMVDADGHGQHQGVVLTGDDGHAVGVAGPQQPLLELEELVALGVP